MLINGRSSKSCGHGASNGFPFLDLILLDGIESVLQTKEPLVQGTPAIPRFIEILISALDVIPSHQCVVTHHWNLFKLRMILSSLNDG